MEVEARREYIVEGRVLECERDRGAGLASCQDQGISPRCCCCVERRACVYICRRRHSVTAAFYLGRRQGAGLWKRRARAPVDVVLTGGELFRVAGGGWLVGGWWKGLMRGWMVM